MIPGASHCLMEPQLRSFVPYGNGSSLTSKMSQSNAWSSTMIPPFARKSSLTSVKTMRKSLDGTHAHTTNTKMGWLKRSGRGPHLAPSSPVRQPHGSESIIGLKPCSMSTNACGGSPHTPTPTMKYPWSYLLVPFARTFFGNRGPSATFTMKRLKVSK